MKKMSTRMRGWRKAKDLLRSVRALMLPVMTAPVLLTAARYCAAALAIMLLASEAAWADCSPAAANNAVATCTGTTNNQGAGAPGTSADTTGYGTGTETAVTVTVDSNATVTATNQAISVADGTIINGAGASITGGWGIRAATGSINLTNSGIVAGTSPGASYGIFVFTDATVTNNAGATITGGDAGIRASNGSITLVNSGSVIATRNTFGGVYAKTNATVTNNAGASITSRGTTIGGILGFVSVINSGSITGTGTQSAAIRAGTSATVTNNAGGSIAGTWYGIDAAGGGSSVVNAGSISGSIAAIRFAGTGNTLTLAAGSAITGNVLGTGSDTFQLGGSGAATFDVSQLDAAGQYRGFGTFNKIDSSVWTLTGASTFAGPINVNGGTLQFNQAASIGGAGATVSVASGATAATGYAMDQAFLARLNPSSAGVAALAADSGNALDLNAAGLTNVSLGAVGSATYSGTLTPAGTLYRLGGGGGTLTMASALTGANDLVVAGNGTTPGTVILAANNTFSGITTISAGTLQIGNGGTAGSLGSGDVFNNATLAINRADVVTLANAISGTGALQQNGTGTTRLTGTSTYTGATVVNAGTLSVNGSIASSAVTVNSGGTLGGNGSVGDTTINGGTLSPGNSIGTLNVTGNLVFTAASSYMVEVSPVAADRTNVSGTATLGGATVNASFAAGSYVTKQYTIVNASGGVIGSFGTQVNTNLPSNFTSKLSYDANNAYLNLTLNYTPTPTPDPTPTPGPTPVAPSYIPLSGNQQNVANALVGFFNRTGGIPLVFGGLNAAGLGQAAGESGTGSQQTSFDAATQFMGMMTDPFAAGRDESAVSSFADQALNYAGKRNPSDALAAIYRKAPLAPAFEPRWNVWAAGFGGSQTTDGNTATGSNTATSRIYGTAVGADYRFSPNTIAGFALAGGGSNFSVNGSGSGRSDLFQAGAFVRHMIGSAYITGAAAYGWQDITTDRTVGGSALQGRFSANAYSGRIEAGNRTAMPWLGGVGITPYAAVQVTALDLPAYAETVASGSNLFALSYTSKTVTAIRSELGLRSDRSFAVNDAVLTLRGRAAWAHDYNTERAAAATFQSLPGASFVVNGATPARDAALTTASAETRFRNGITLAASFEGEFSQVTRSYAGKGAVRYQW
jgi:autotransporter-associated beta strand protein